MTTAAKLLNETRLSMAALARRENVQRRTVARWIKVGVRGLRLEAIRVGVAWITSEEAFERWVHKLNPELNRGYTPRSASRRSEVAKGELKRLGVL